MKTFSIQKHFLQVTITFLLHFSFLHAQVGNQSRLWSIPPNQIKFPSVTASSLPIADYNGQQAQYACNAMHDANGNLLFFIIDHGVYDKNGKLIGDIFMPSPLNSVNLFVQGTSEWLIVPVPNDCKKYYLIGGGYTTNDINAGGVPAPFYIVLDLTLHGANPSSQGGFTNPNQIANLLTTTNASTYPLGSIHMAVTPLRPTGDRFLFVCNNNNIYRYLVTNAGINYDGYMTPDLPNAYQFSSSISRNEMELVQFGDGYYKLAVGYETTGGSCAINYFHSIFVGLFNLAGVLQSQIVFPLPCTNIGEDYLLKGLEFSPDGNYLYVAHNNAPYLEYIDFSVPSPVLAPFAGLTLPNAILTPQDFEFSQIELGNDGKLYFAATNRLASLDISPTGNGNPIGSPNGATWNDAAVPNISVPLTTAIGSSNYYTLRLLNDQIDGEVYQNYSPTNVPTSCCLFNSGFTKDAFTAVTSSSFPSTTQIWTPNHNPFGGTQSNSVSTVTIRNKLTIPAGYTITISGMSFQFAPRVNSNPQEPGANVVIEKWDAIHPNQGGKLILNNSIFTSYNGCGTGMWEGIEVRGDKTQPQSSSSGSKQGWLVLQNNSVVENAFMGAVTARTNTSFPNLSYNQNSSGGIIQASNSVFRNNKVGVSFLPYTDSQNLLHNYSRFSKCKFITTSFALNDPSAIFSVFVVMIRTEGIIFYGNNFENSRNVIIATEIPQNGIGIFSYGSGFQVLPQCNNIFCTSYTANIFKNLSYGIQAWQTNSVNTFKVDKTVFSGNHAGILLNFINYATISNNTFNVLEYSSLDSPGPSYGIYLNNCTGYQVEGNQFAYQIGGPPSSNYDGTYGMVVNNSGPYSNLIYRNTFHQIYIGTQAQRKNCHTQTQNIPTNDYGLEFRCNSFDFHAIGLYDIVEPNGCIDYYQGYAASNCSTCPANNKFSHLNAENIIDLYLDPSGPYSMNYTHPIPYPSYYPLYKPYGTSNVFYTDNGTAPPICPPSPVFCYNCRRTSITSDVQQLLQLQSLIDGGITSTLIADINGNMSPGQLKTELLQYSPYLSDQVLIAYINMADVPPGNLKEVLVANSSLRPAVIAAYNLIAASLPNGIQTNIQAVQIGTSPLDKLLGQISGVQSDKNLQVDALIRDFLTDTTLTNGLDSVQMVLKIYGVTIEDKCKLAATQVTAKQFADATITLDTIRIAEGGILDNSCTLLEILIRLEQSENGITSIKTDTAFAADSATVRLIAADTTRDGFVGAQSLLRAIFEVSFREIIDPIPNSSSERLAPPAVNAIAPMEQGKIYPNPNNGTMLFSYEIPEQSKGILILYDISGKQVDCFVLHEGQNIAQISDDKLGNGIYFYRFVVDDGQVNSGKFVIIK